MSMTVVVTRNVSARVRGFLASAMLELAPGVYSAPRISPAVRERIWSVLADWFPNEEGASIVMIWQEREMPGGQAVRTLGTPPIAFAEVDGLILARRPASPGNE
ncbi:type I-E CRISPR-associated endoribonuclease Cas2e [Thermochromatium tepidum]|uniref:Type I-E CRISPR-associated endoribonuclease Cas2 n=1 Tax=Thermochromatium tepidum ATCC 43061 TaxID=316276 RepID=A0A6I6EEN4_THETI|nr:type I-E CRISPR-associated endoribonuclease Cas2e [Thermochromatium tepidum]QGU33449.1 type I-E CRISPR-associated endoribonuclease Cas2 [Thermochromatium tepidum ATCC 43061]